MDSRESSRFTAPLAQRLAKDADAGQIADAICAMWSDIESALQPVLGPRGVAALFERSLYLVAARYPWLAPLKAAWGDAGELMTELKAALSAQQPGVAAQAGTEIFTTFRELLTTLIGDRLSERLLQAAWSPPTSAPPAQDPTP